MDFFPEHPIIRLHAFKPNILLSVCLILLYYTPAILFNIFQPHDMTVTNYFTLAMCEFISTFKN